MRELTVREIEIVSGAGKFCDMTTWIGSKAGDFIGGSIGSLVTIPVISTLVSKATAFIGKQIGSFIGNAFGNWVEGWFSSTDGSDAAG